MPYAPTDLGVSATPLRWGLAAFVVLAAGQAHAQALDEFAGVRTMSMGGVQRAVGTTNDAIYANPAGIALEPRYDIEVAYMRSHMDGVNAFNASVVDGRTGPVAGGLAYTYTGSGARDTGLHRFYAPLAMTVSNALSLGLTVKHLSGHYMSAFDDTVKPSLWSGDLGALAKLSDTLRVGLSARNIWRNERSALLRRDLGAGLAYVSADNSITISGEGVWDLEDKTRATAWRAGAEYVAGGSFPLRVGYQHRPYTARDGSDAHENVLSAGAGIDFGGAGSLNVGYESSLDRHDTWKLGFNAALKL